MRLSQFLLKIEKIAGENDISPVFIVGGVPRDKVLANLNKLNDIDLTTGDDSIHYLAKELSIKLKGPGVVYRVMGDGHSRLMVGDLKIDFSSNFKIPKITEILTGKGIEHPSSMLEELYSRDFTCNTLLMPMTLDKIDDLTGLAKQDIEEKVLRTCLEPNLTLGYDPKRIVRMIYLAAKLGFKVDAHAIDWVIQHPQVLAQVQPEYWTKKLVKAFKYNHKTTLDMIKILQIGPYLPRSPALTQYLGKT